MRFAYVGNAMPESGTDLYGDGDDENCERCVVPVKTCECGGVMLPEPDVGV